MGDTGIMDKKTFFSSACCCNAWLQIKFIITVATIYQDIAGFMNSRAALARHLRVVASLCPIQVPASSQYRHCRRPPALIARP